MTPPTDTLSSTDDPLAEEIYEADRQQDGTVVSRPPWEDTGPPTRRRWARIAAVARRRVQQECVERLAARAAEVIGVERADKEGR